MKLQLSTFVALVALTSTLAAQERPGQQRPGQQDAQERPATRRTDDAQDPSAATRGAQRGAERPAGQANQMQALDAFIAAGLIIDNQEEIELNRAALDKIQNEQAKQYAQKMIEDHSKIVQQLQQIVPQDVTTELQFTSAPAGERANGQQRPAERTPNQPNDATDRLQDTPRSETPRSETNAPRREEPQTTRRPGATGAQDEADVHLTAVVITRGAPMHRMLMIHRSKAENCLAISKKQLEEASQGDVDQVYLGQQVAAHVAMLSKLRALEGQTGAELQQLVAQAEKGTQQHLQMAEQLMKQIGSAGAGERPANNQ